MQNNREREREGGREGEGEGEGEGEEATFRDLLVASEVMGGGAQASLLFQSRAYGVPVDWRLRP